MADDEEIDPIALDVKRESDSQVLKRNLNSAFEVNPDKQADLNKLSTKSGVPSYSLTSPENEAWVKNMARMNDLDPEGMVKSHPMTANALTDEQFAKIAHDDVENLKGLEDSFSVIGKRTSSTLDEMLANTEKQAAVAGYLMLTFGPEGQDVDGMASFIADRNRPLADAQAKAPQYQKRFQERLEEADGWMADAGVILSSPRAVGRSIVVNAPNMVVPSLTAYGAAQAAVPVAAGAAAATSAVFPPAAPLVAGAVEVGAATAGGFAGGSLLEMGFWMDQELANAGVDVTDPVAIAAKFRDPEFVNAAKQRAIAKGLTTAGIDALWNASFAGRFAKGMKPGQTLKNVGKGAADVSVGAVGESVAELGGQVAATGEFDTGEVLLEGFSSLGQSVFDTSLYSQIRKGDVDTAAQAVSEQKVAEVQSLHDAARKVKTAQRDPAAVKAMIEAANPDARVYLDNQVAATFFQELDADSQKRLEEAIPDLRDRIAEAQASGSDIMLNRSDYVAYIASTEQGLALVPHVKFDANDLSAYQITQEEYLSSMYDLTPDVRVDDQYTYFEDRLVEELVASGRVGNRDIARTSVAPLARFLFTMEQRGGDAQVTSSLIEGISVEGPDAKPSKRITGKDIEINKLKEYGAKTVADVAKGQKALETRRANARKKAEQMGLPYVEPKYNPKTSRSYYPVLNMLKKRGGIYTGSKAAQELAAMDVTPQRFPWVFESKPSRKSGNSTISALTEFDGIPLQEANEALDPLGMGAFTAEESDNGYVPSQAIYDAIAREVAGDPIVARDSDGMAETYDQALEYLDRLGIDLATADNEIIKQALADPEAFLAESVDGEVPSDQETIASYNQSAEGLRSALLDAANDLKQEKGTGEQFLAQLSKTAGVKAEEIAWTGLDDFLKGKKSVTKEQVVKYLEENQVQINEVTLGSERFAVRDSEQFDVAVFDTREEAEQMIRADGREDYQIEVVNDPGYTSSKFSKYTLDGGTNYREVLMTLPDDRDPLSYGEWLKSIGKDGAGNSVELRNQHLKYSSDFMKNSRGGSFYNKNHYSQANILAHVRLKDHVSSDGKKVLLIEEAQSDWHQKGRKEGYYSKPKEYSFDPEKLQENELSWEYQDQGRTFTVGKGVEDERAGAESYIKRLITSANRDEDMKATLSVPDAPLKKSWHEMTFRRVAQMAAQGGYDRVAWTTGEQQNDRYDLSKHVKMLSVTRSRRGDGGYVVYAEGLDGGALFRGVNGWSDAGQKTMGAQELEDTVGKEVASRAIEGANQLEADKWFDIKDDELKIGGSGMKGFYDDILSKYAGKFGKKFGAKVSDIKLSREREKIKEPEYEWMNNTMPGLPDVQVHSMDITPEMRAAAEKGFELFQKNRGKVSFMRDGRYIVQLFETSDLSTFLHETGHIFLDAYNRYATAADAPEQITSDMQTVLEFLGVASYEDVKVEQHEKFAKAFENYLMSGEAPSVGLRGVFQKFKAWLTRIYQGITGMGTKVDPALKAVFDRMLATDEEIAQVQKDEGFRLNEDVLSILDKAEQERYQKIADKSLEQAKEGLLKRTLKQKERETTKWWKEERAKLREQITEDVHNDPVYRAMNFTRTGKFLEKDNLIAPPAMKINRKDAERILGKTVMGNLPKTTFSRDGVSADSMAEMMGYIVGNGADGYRTGTGTELLMAMVNTGPMKAHIDRLTDDEMVARHGDMMIDGTIEKEALEAFHNDAQALKLEMEGKAAAKLAGLQFGSNTNFELAAQRLLSQKRIQDAANSDRFYRGAIKAARTYGKALKSKDYVAAVKAKQQHLLSHHLYKQSLEARWVMEKSMKVWERLTRPDEKLSKSMDVNYIYVARAILGRYGILPYNPGNLQAFFNNIQMDDPEAYDDLLLAVEQNTQAVPELETRDVTYTKGKMAGRTVTQRKEPWTKLTLEEFLGLKDSVDNVLGVGRNQKTMMIDGQRVERDLVIQDLEARMAKLPETSIATGARNALEWHDKGKLAISSIRAGMRRVESWTDVMDGNFGGVFRKYIWNPVNDARNTYLEEKHQYLQKMADLLKPADVQLNDSGKIFAHEIGYNFQSKSELIGMLLHIGNESNFGKLVRGGRGQGEWSPANFQAMLHRMMNDGTITKEDMDLTQNMWNLVDGLKPAAQKAHKSMYGYYFSEITSWPVETPWGTYKGGYWPAIADHDLSEDASIRQDKENLITVNNSSMFPTTGRGFTKGRVEGYAAPLQFDIKLMPSHVDKVLRFVHLEPAVKDVAKLVNNRQFRKSMERIDPRAARDMLIPWLQRVARQTVETNDSKWFKAVEPVARFFRASASAQAMMLNFLNAIQQLTGFFPAMYRVGKGNMMRALVQYMKNPMKAHEMIYEASPFMRYRNTILADNLQKSVVDIVLNRSKYQKVVNAAQTHGYIMQQVIQSWVDGTTWMAAYDKALAQGMNEKEAVRYSDSVVRETQGSTSATDLSKFEAGTPMTRLFTMFYSYFNTQGNLMTTEVQNIVRQSEGMDRAGRLGYLYLMTFAIPSFMAEALVRGFNGDLPEDEDDDGMVIDDWLAWFAGSQFRYATAMVPWLGQLVNSVVNNFDDKPYNDRLSLSPIFQMGETVGRTPKRVYDAITGEGDVSRAVQDLLTSAGFLTGIPLGQAGKPLGYAANVAEGDEDIDNPLDVVQGVLTGPAPAGGR